MRFSAAGRMSAPTTADVLYSRLRIARFARIAYLVGRSDSKVLHPLLHGEWASDVLSECRAPTVVGPAVKAGEGLHLSRQRVELS